MGKRNEPHEGPRWMFHPGNPGRLRLAQTLEIYRFLKKHGYKIVSSKQIGLVMKRILDQKSYRRNQRQFRLAVQKYLDEHDYMDEFGIKVMDKFIKRQRTDFSPQLLEALASVLGVDQDRLYCRKKRPPGFSLYRVSYQDPQNGYKDTWTHVVATSEDSAEQSVFDSITFPFGYQIHSKVDVKKTIVKNVTFVKHFGDAVGVRVLGPETTKYLELEKSENE